MDGRGVAATVALVWEAGAGALAVSLACEGSLLTFAADIAAGVPVEELLASDGGPKARLPMAPGAAPVAELPASVGVTPTVELPGIAEAAPTTELPATAGAAPTVELPGIAEPAPTTELPASVGEAPTMELPAIAGAELTAGIAPGVCAGIAPGVCAKVAFEAFIADGDVAVELFATEVGGPAAE